MENDHCWARFTQGCRIERLANLQLEPTRRLPWAMASYGVRLSLHVSLDTTPQG